MCDCVTNTDLSNRLNSSYDVTYFSGLKLFFWLKFKLIVPEFLGLVILIGMHEMNRVTKSKRTVYDTAL